MKLVLYEDLDKHFIAPKRFNKEPHFNYKKFPRKLKKSLKKVSSPVGDLNTKMWLLLKEDYKRFLIKKICKISES